jgi:hypothetical protein
MFRSRARSFVQRNPNKLKSRLKKGIPDPVRATVWKKVTQAERRMRENAGMGGVHLPPGLTVRSE